MARIFVGLSGGVDSAVSAALLKEAGHEVVGVFIKIWRPEFIECPWQKERLEAMRVCAHLHIPFREIDLSETYKKEVIDTMVADYARGITPNPDILCNRSIKFGAFKTWALAEGAEKIATGHYARIDVRHDVSYMTLLRGVDTQKDQSYFLARLTEEDLAVTLFPVGGFTKPEVRTLATRFKLPNAGKKDSQGLCFVGDVSMRDFLARYIPLNTGDVLDEFGNCIGEHGGAALYTLGERHGFRVESTSSTSQPWYVVGVDTVKNTIIVSHDRTRTARETIPLFDMQWIGKQSQLPTHVLAQTRYREEPVEATVEYTDKGYRATFEKPHLATPGQICALYTNNTLIGSAIIGL